MSETLLEVEALEAGYDDVQVLWGISLKVAHGQMTTLLGANGAGKTTTSARHHRQHPPAEWPRDLQGRGRDAAGAA